MNTTELYAAHRATMNLIARLVANVNCYVPKQLADRREQLEAEMVERGLNVPGWEVVA